MTEYSPTIVETKWQEFWELNRTFETGKPGDKKFYCLDMFPYPSGAGLDLGQVVGYSATDIYARYKRMNGYSVLRPIGYDAFGLPTEQLAVSTGERPEEITAVNCARLSRQLKSLGLAYDWEREILTCAPEYYRWTQWIFLKLYGSWFDEKQGKARSIETLPIPQAVFGRGEGAVEEYRNSRRLAYYADSRVNWCEELGTVLANEEVIGGYSERGHHPVVRKPMKQWMLRITKYAERLIDGLEAIDWPENIKEQQRNWIGKAPGVEITFPVAGGGETIEIFTTRPETIFGATFLMISPEHPQVPEITHPERKAVVSQYCEQAASQSDFVRVIENRKKSGIFTGSYGLNPFTNEPIPIYVSDSLLMSFARGAVMGIPAHDERDFELARMLQLEIRPVFAPFDEDAHIYSAVVDGEIPWKGGGEMLPTKSRVAHDLGLEGLDNREAARRITKWLMKHDLAKNVVHYRLRDWVFSRQRYWGEPIPVVHWENGKTSALLEEDLPLLLPRLEDCPPGKSGEPPLARAEGWLSVIDRGGSNTGRRETSTMPQWAGSCWYYLRFTDPTNGNAPWDQQCEQEWMPVDLYIGGSEHALLHLLYARFWHMVLFDLGYVSTPEPFKRMVSRGAVLLQSQSGRAVSPTEKRGNGRFQTISSGEELARASAKASKLVRSAIDFTEIFEKFGADVLRVYLMFTGPLDGICIWDDRAVVGIQRFLRRVWHTFACGKDGDKRVFSDQVDESPLVLRALHIAIEKVTRDIEALKFHTAIAALMELFAILSRAELSRQTVESFVVLLSPFAPHLGEELWERIGHNRSVAFAPWPSCDFALLKETTVPVVVQVNGKKRAVIEVAADTSEDELRKIVIGRMAKTATPVDASDRFIFVRSERGDVPRLLSVVSAPRRKKSGVKLGVKCRK